MPEAYVEPGIGETRAIVVAGGAIVEAHIERDDGAWRAGDVRAVRLTRILVPGVRGIVAADGVEALLTPLPPGLTEGAAVRVAVVREALPEAGRPRLAKVVVTDRPTGAGPRLADRLAARGLTVHQVSPEPDRLEAAGWSEVVESALTGHVAFAGGALTISPTPAMTVIDVDGDLPPVALALAAADAVAAAIVRFDLTGSIGIDFPTVGDRVARRAIGERFDAALPPPFERTAINGFGFVQIVRPRRRASFIETLRGDRAATAALALLRTAAKGCGGGRIVASPAVVAWLTGRPALLAALERQRGGPLDLRGDGTVSISGGYVTVPA